MAAKKKNEMSLGEAIDLYLQENNLKEQALIQRVIAEWPRIMGKAVADQTERLHFKDGIFFVKISHPVWKQEIGMARSKVCEMLNKELGAQLIKEVRVY